MAKKKKTNPRRQVATMADIQKAKNQALRDFSILALGAAAMAAHDAFGFGPARLEKLVENLRHKLTDSYDFYTPDDAAKWVLDYVGIDIRSDDYWTGKKKL